MNTIEREDRFEFDVYPKRPVSIVRGEGTRVWDEDGKEYIDCVAGHGVANLGHCNPEVVEAIRKQSEQLITCPMTFYNDVRADLVEKLVDITPRSLNRAFLCNSGTESVEAALKFARYTTGKKEFVAAMRGFHGRSMGALSATFKRKHRKDFEPLVPGFSFVPFNDFEALQEEVNEDTAGIILEVIQGEGGVNPGDEEYFEKVQELCDERDVLLIIDEVQTGFCRTGEMFACDHFGIEPDMLCLAKAIAGGFPMGAVVCSDKIKVPKGKHGTTFGGNPLACAAALASIDFMLENNLAEQAREKGDYLLEELRELDSGEVREVRGKGLMIGIELKERVKQHILDLLDEGVLALPAGSTVLRLLPPLTISYGELDLVVEGVRKVLEENQASAADRGS